MFLNAAFRDFDDVFNVTKGVSTSQHMSRNSICLDPDDTSLQASETNNFPDLGTGDDHFFPRSLPHMVLSLKESRLWDYFSGFIAPKCAVSLNTNPYRNVVLRAAAHAPKGPLFLCIMAISASQMHSLGHGENEASAWTFRGLALGSLRRHLLEKKHISEEAIVASVMLSFLEVSIARVLSLFAIGN